MIPPLSFLSSLLNTTLRVGRAESNKTQQKQLAVFDVGIAKLRLNQKHCAPRLDPKVPKTACRF
jgi:hypothetical protein